MPHLREAEIAEHACRKYSGRVGRSAMAKEFGAKAVRLAVTAHIRHTETNYDHLLNTTPGRAIARAQVLDRVNFMLRCWSLTEVIFRSSRIASRPAPLGWAKRADFFQRVQGSVNVWFSSGMEQDAPSTMLQQ
jgi:hypothetical protein